jgi:hypothetical protein
MKLFDILLILILGLSSCSEQRRSEARVPIEGTWKLFTATLIEDGDTTTTSYTSDVSMIKIINATHFSFLNHDVKKGADSTSGFSAGGGRYTLSGNEYTEHLEYCSYREWEGNTFHFTVTIEGDTLIQRGVEKIEDLGVDRLNIEKYVKVAEPGSHATFP